MQVPPNGVCWHCFSAKDKERVTVSSKFPCCFLTFSSGCTDGPFHFVVTRSFLLRQMKQKVKLPCLKSRLAHYTKLISYRKRFQVISCFDDQRILTCPSLDTLHLRMTLLPNDDDKPTFLGKGGGCLLCFPHMGASGINDLKSFLFGFLINLRSCTMGTKDNRITSGKSASVSLHCTPFARAIPQPEGYEQFHLGWQY